MDFTMMEQLEDVRIPVCRNFLAGFGDHEPETASALIIVAIAT